jgi:hypothetical protein
MAADLPPALLGAETGVTEPQPSRMTQDRLRLLVALVLPPLAWYSFQQGLGMSLRNLCAAGGPPIGPLCGVGALFACAVAWWLAWQTAGRSPKFTNPLALFASRIALLGDVIFALAIGFQTLATLIIPPCVS